MKILTTKFNTKYDTAPFQKNKKRGFSSCFIEGIALAKAEIDAIVKTKRHLL
jgi:peptidyl-dipeptidase Dcp